MNVKEHFGSKYLYQPSINRLPSFICLIAASLALIALVEITCRRLPVHDANGFVPSLQGIANTTGMIRARNTDLDPQNGETRLIRALMDNNGLC